MIKDNIKIEIRKKIGIIIIVRKLLKNGLYGKKEY